MRLTILELKQLVRGIAESTVPLKIPVTPEQKNAFISLLTWAAGRMRVPKQDIDSAVSKAQSEDWSEALDLMQTFYVMKNIKSKRVA